MDLLICCMESMKTKARQASFFSFVGCTVIKTEPDWRFDRKTRNWSAWSSLVFPIGSFTQSDRLELVKIGSNRHVLMQTGGKKPGRSNQGQKVNENKVAKNSGGLVGMGFEPETTCWGHQHHTASLPTLSWPCDIRTCYILSIPYEPPVGPANQWTGCVARLTTGPFSITMVGCRVLQKKQVQTHVN